MIETHMKIGRSKPEVWWTQRSGSSKTARVVELLEEGNSSVDRPNGWVWWSWAWCRARLNKAPAAYLCVGVRYDDGVGDTIAFVRCDRGFGCDRSWILILILQLQLSNAVAFGIQLFSSFLFFSLTDFCIFLYLIFLYFLFLWVFVFFSNNK